MGNQSSAAVVGFLYSLWVMGPKPLNPKNVGWLTPDAAQHQIAWELYRQDPNLHWPITFTDRIGYPQGESVSLLDPDPLIAVVLKPFSRFLPEPMQYQGPEVVAICVLQLFFALVLFRVLLGSDALAVILPSLFFLIAPPLAWRFVGHYAMDNHWLILASLLVFCLAQRKTPGTISRFLVWAMILEALAVAINPYLTLQIMMLLGATIISLIWQRRLTIPRAVGIVTVLGLTGYLVASTFGLIIHGGRGYAAGGYRSFSLNLLGLLDPQEQGSILLPRLPRIFLQYEGYNYLGLGAILLVLVAASLLFLRRREFPKLQIRVMLPLLAACLLLTALALSTKVTFGTLTLLDLDPQEKLTPYLGALRASGRLFWTSYYVLLGSALATIFLCLRRSWAIALTSCALLVQLIDTGGLRRWIHSEVNQPHYSPLRSPVWSKLGAVHKNLMIMPPWQCGNGASSPGGALGFETFGYLAAAQRMRINSYYAARYTEINKDKQCGDAVANLSQRPLSPDSAYVVTPLLAEQIAEGPTGPGKCHNVDHFILCSAKTDFGLSPTLASPLEQLKDAIVDPGFEDRDLSAWARWLEVKATVSHDHPHSGTDSLAESGDAGSVYQDVTGLEAGHTYTVSAWVSALSGGTATAQIAVYDPTANVATFSALADPTPEWHLVEDSVAVSAPGTLRIHLFRNKGTGTIFWDDVRIYRAR